jgi:hypothetical protein
MNAFIIHGTFGHPGENWFPWLKGELEKLGCKVFVPKFPTPEGQNLDAWMKAFEPYLSEVDEETVFVAHSLGPAFVLSVLEKLEKPVRACFFVSGFTGRLGREEFDSLNNDIADRSFDWEKVKRNCKRFVLFHSDNDPYVPLEKAQNLGQNLGSKPTIVKEAGHFNEESGFLEFPLILDEIKGVLK